MICTVILKRFISISFLLFFFQTYTSYLALLDKEHIGLIGAHFLFDHNMHKCFSQLSTLSRTNRHIHTTINNYYIDYIIYFFYLHRHCTQYTECLLQSLFNLSYFYSILATRTDTQKKLFVSFLSQFPLALSCNDRTDKSLLMHVFSDHGIPFLPHIANNVKVHPTDMVNINGLNVIFEESPFKDLKQFASLCQISSDLDHLYGTRFGTPKTNTLLMLACSKKFHQGIRHLLQHGAHINARNNYRQNVLFYVNDVKSLDILLEYKPSLNCKDVYGNTPLLHVASLINKHDHNNGVYVNLIQKLLAAQANFTLTNNKNKNLLHYLVETRSTTKPSLVAHFLETYYTPTSVHDITSMVNKQADCGHTPLHIAIIKGDVNTVILLLKKNADPFLKSNQGKNAFELAQQSKRTNPPPLRKQCQSHILSYGPKPHGETIVKILTNYPKKDQ